MPLIGLPDPYDKKILWPLRVQKIPRVITSSDSMTMIESLIQQLRKQGKGGLDFVNSLYYDKYRINFPSFDRFIEHRKRGVNIEDMIEEEAQLAKIMAKHSRAIFPHAMDVLGNVTPTIISDLEKYIRDRKAETGTDATPRLEIAKDIFKKLYKYEYGSNPHKYVPPAGLGMTVMRYPGLPPPPGGLEVQTSEVIRSDAAKLSAILRLMDFVDDVYMPRLLKEEISAGRVDPSISPESQRFNTRLLWDEFAATGKFKNELTDIYQSSIEEINQKLGSRYIGNVISILGPVSSVINVIRYAMHVNEGLSLEERLIADEDWWNSLSKSARGAMLIGDFVGPMMGSKLVIGASAKAASKKLVTKGIEYAGAEELTELTARSMMADSLLTGAKTYGTVAAISVSIGTIDGFGSSPGSFSDKLVNSVSSGLSGLIAINTPSEFLSEHGAHPALSITADVLSYGLGIGIAESIKSQGRYKLYRLLRKASSGSEEATLELYKLVMSRRPPATSMPELPTGTAAAATAAAAQTIKAVEPEPISTYSPASIETGRFMAAFNDEVWDASRRSIISSLSKKESNMLANHRKVIGEVLPRFDILKEYGADIEAIGNVLDNLNPAEINTILSDPRFTYPISPTILRAVAIERGVTGVDDLILLKFDLVRRLLRSKRGGSYKSWPGLYEEGMPIMQTTEDALMNLSNELDAYQAPLLAEIAGYSVKTKKYKVVVNTSDGRSTVHEFYDGKLASNFAAITESTIKVSDPGALVTVDIIEGRFPIGKVPTTETRLVMYAKVNDKMVKVRGVPTFAKPQDARVWLTETREGKALQFKYGDIDSKEFAQNVEFRPTKSVTYGEELIEEFLPYESELAKAEMPHTRRAPVIKPKKEVPVETEQAATIEPSTSTMELYKSGESIEIYTLGQNVLKALLRPRAKITTKAAAVGKADIDVKPGDMPDPDTGYFYREVTVDGDKAEVYLFRKFRNQPSRDVKIIQIGDAGTGPEVAIVASKNVPEPDKIDAIVSFLSGKYLKHADDPGIANDPNLFVRRYLDAAITRGAPVQPEFIRGLKAWSLYMDSTDPNKIERIVSMESERRSTLVGVSKHLRNSIYRNLGIAKETRDLAEIASDVKSAVASPHTVEISPIAGIDDAYRRAKKAHKNATFVETLRKIELNEPEKAHLIKAIYDMMSDDASTIIRIYDSLDNVSDVDKTFFRVQRLIMRAFTGRSYKSPIFQKLQSDNMNAAKWKYDAIYRSDDLLEELIRKAPIDDPDFGMVEYFDDTGTLEYGSRLHRAYTAFRSALHESMSYKAGTDTAFAIEGTSVTRMATLPKKWAAESKVSALQDKLFEIMTEEYNIDPSDAMESITLIRNDAKRLPVGSGKIGEPTEDLISEMASEIPLKGETPEGALKMPAEASKPAPATRTPEEAQRASPAKLEAIKGKPVQEPEPTTPSPAAQAEIVKPAKAAKPAKPARPEDVSKPAEPAQKQIEEPVTGVREVTKDESDFAAGLKTDENGTLRLKDIYDHNPEFEHEIANIEKSIDADPGIGKTIKSYALRYIRAARKSISEYDHPFTPDDADNQVDGYIDMINDNLEFILGAENTSEALDAYKNAISELEGLVKTPAPAQAPTSTLKPIPMTPEPAAPEPAPPAPETLKPKRGRPKKGEEKSVKIAEVAEELEGAKATRVLGDAKLDIEVSGGKVTTKVDIKNAESTSKTKRIVEESKASSERMTNIDIDSLTIIEPKKRGKEISLGSKVEKKRDVPVVIPKMPDDTQALLAEYVNALVSESGLSITIEAIRGKSRRRTKMQVTRPSKELRDELRAKLEKYKIDIERLDDSVKKLISDTVTGDFDSKLRSRAKIVDGTRYASKPIRELAQTRSLRTGIKDIDGILDQLSESIDAIEVERDVAVKNVLEKQLEVKLADVIKERPDIPYDAFDDIVNKLRAEAMEMTDAISTEYSKLLRAETIKAKAAGWLRGCIDVNSDISSKTRISAKTANIIKQTNVKVDKTLAAAFDEYITAVEARYSLLQAIRSEGSIFSYIGARSSRTESSMRRRIGAIYTSYYEGRMNMARERIIKNLDGTQNKTGIELMNKSKGVTIFKLDSSGWESAIMNLTKKYTTGGLTLGVMAHLIDLSDFDG